MNAKSRKIINLARNTISILVILLLVFIEIMIVLINPKLDYKSLLKHEESIEETIEKTETETVIESLNIMEIETKENQTTEFSTVPETYFRNSLFIGDSRMVGFNLYKQLPGATYFAYESYGVFNGTSPTLEIPKYGVISLSDLLSIHKFDKIYICLGINNLQASTENHKKQYLKFLDEIIEKQPNAIIYLIANFHVTDEENQYSYYANNMNINAVNSFISDIAKDKGLIYLDPNEVLDDENGNLNKEYTYDNCHLTIKNNDKVLDYLLNHAILK